MLRALFLAPYPAEAASTRFRATQYFPYLEEHGVSCELAPMLSSREFSTFYSREGRWAKGARLLGSAVRQALAALSSRPYDVVVVQRGALLFGPPVLEWLMRNAKHRPLVFDIDDAIWMHDPMSAWGVFAKLIKFPSKVQRITEMASEVIVCNDYTRDFALKFRTPESVTVIPTVVDANAFRPVARSSDSLPIVGWIGTHSTAEYLEDIVPPIREVATRHPFLLKIVGSSRGWNVQGVEVVTKPWSLDSEVSDYQSLDIGLYPVRDSDWGKGKSGFKPVVYMSSGAVCLASPVGGVTEFLTDRVNGLLASTPREWCEGLTQLVIDGDLRLRLSQAARNTVLEWYCLDVQAPRLLGVLRRAAAA